MLTHIAIRDFAIIDTLELDLTSGMSVLTGETGAGKSILVDALGLVLGDRADTEMIRHGCERTEITAEFNIRNLPAVNNWLSRNDLDTNDECILRRIIGKDGRSRGLINNRSVPLQSLRELGEQLVDIHGQHEHQSLLKPGVQMSIIDSFGDHNALRAEVAGFYGNWKITHESLEQLRAAAQDREQRLNLLRHQVNELQALALQPGEIPTLDDEHRRLANSGRLMEGVQSALDSLYENEENSAYHNLHQALHALDNLANLDKRLGDLYATLKATEVQLTDASEALRHYLHDADIDPQRLDWLENRLGAIHDLARKHRAEPEALPVLLQSLSEELHGVENADMTLQALETELIKLHDGYGKCAAQLHNRRKRVADVLGGQVTAGMRELGMPGGQFAIHIENQPERFTSNGTDQVEFQVTANKGQPLRSMVKVASGGELSRIALAIQVVAAQASAIPTMIFDEVDAGIGGGVAEIVGRRLRDLGGKRQVLCVTHLPQVASQAHQHFRVIKSTDGKNMLTTVEKLDRKTTVEELARMLGGVEITETTRKHAREMMDRASQNG